MYVDACLRRHVSLSVKCVCMAWLCMCECMWALCRAHRYMYICTYMSVSCVHLCTTCKRVCPCICLFVHVCIWHACVKMYVFTRSDTRAPPRACHLLHCPSGGEMGHRAGHGRWPGADLARDLLPLGGPRLRSRIRGCRAASVVRRETERELLPTPPCRLPWTKGPFVKSLGPSALQGGA